MKNKSSLLVLGCGFSRLGCLLGSLFFCFPGRFLLLLPGLLFSLQGILGRFLLCLLCFLSGLFIGTY